MISALAPPDRALTPRPDGQNIDGNNTTTQQTPTTRKGGFERAFKDVDGARQARAKTPKDISPDQAAEVVGLAGPARIIGDKYANSGKSGRREAKSSGGSGMVTLEAGLVNGAKEANIATPKSQDVLAGQKQTSLEGVSANKPSEVQKKANLGTKPPPEAALEAGAVGKGVKKPNLGKPDVEKSGSKKKAATKQQRPTKIGATATPSQAVIGNLAKSLADGKTDRALDQDKSLSGGAPGLSEIKLATAATIGPITRVDTGPAVARAVAVQISQAALNGADRMVEITLDPAELGKVKMKLHPSDAGITVQIIADRADTIDLMRRNSAMLEAEFRDAGYDNINFAFSQNNNGGHGGADAEPAPIAWLGEGRADVSGSSGSSPVSSARTITGIGPSEGLDIRL
ncbi:MAG: flagellar hook-length control protein FliK [Alphaproteobacteria bacterium]|nr:flagellar hook-length control protein FliK [Alphaproteobacteria bacterium]